MGKTKLTASICHIARFLKSGIPSYNPEENWEEEEEEEEEKEELRPLKFYFNS